MFSFEGDYRRKPVQALGGSSKKEPREILLQRTQEERKKRELLKKQQASCIKVQAFYRSTRARHTVKQNERQEFDVLRDQLQESMKHLSHSSALIQTDYITHLTRQLVFFYNDREDSERLIWLCQVVLKQKDIVVNVIGPNQATHVYQIKKLLQFCSRLLERNACTSGSIAIPLRMLETFTDLHIYLEHIDSPSTVSYVLQKIFEHLIRNGYYRSIRVLIDNKVPASIENPECLMTPQSSFSAALNLICRPLNLQISAEPSENTFKHTVLQSLCGAMFSHPHTEAITRLLIPSLIHGKQQFPFLLLLQSLIPSSHLDQLERDGFQYLDGWSLTVQPSVWLLYSILRLSENQLDKIPTNKIPVLLNVLCKLVPTLCTQRRKPVLEEDVSDSDDDEMEVESESDMAEVCRESFRMLESPQITRCILALSRQHDLGTITAICTLCYTLMEENCLEIHKTRLLYSLAFTPQFLVNLWNACLSVSSQSNNGVQSSLLQMLSRGLTTSTLDLRRIIPLLSIFCSHFSHFLMSLHDSEFLNETNSKKTMPFSLNELAHISQMLCDTCLGIIELTHPGTKPVVGSHRSITSLEDLNQQQEMLISVFKVIVKLVKQLYDRDCRRRFCPEGHWLSKSVLLPIEKNTSNGSSVNFIRRPFGTLSILYPRRTIDEDTPLLSTHEVRRNIILSEMPFVVPFQERVRIFRDLVQEDKRENQGEIHGFSHDSISIMVRRSHLYEDSFEKLSPENEPDLKKQIQVQLVNFAGLDEAGIDGGGIFREFMSELMKTAFDPNRGFFKCTSDKLLYPNPQAKLIVDNFTNHYFFLGRILGKVIYENMLIEMPFASFFLSKLVSLQRCDVDIHHLASLDPEMYKNLLSLKDYDGNISDLGLDFTVVNNELGEAQVEELKPNGKDILVTNQNHIEYIHLMADYRLNKQMRPHCNAFRTGLAEVVNIDWLRLFDHNELQLVISGAQTPIDLEDLKKNTNYSGGYAPDHPVIVIFWRVVEEFTDKQKRQLLKFATSCSRPPLLGFKELRPAFCIHYAGREPDRLPTASTCSNLLKLPEFQNEETLRQKLLYAIESGAGFELS